MILTASATETLERVLMEEIERKEPTTFTDEGACRKSVDTVD